MAELLFDEDRLVAEATGNQPVLYNDVLVAVWRGQDAKATELLEATRREASARGMGRFVSSLTYLESVLNNALGRYDAAREAAWQAFERNDLGFGTLIVPELAEAASRTGDAALLETTLEWVTDRAHVTPTEWARGIEARVRALSSDGGAAEALYREALERLGRTRLRIELARTHLLYGEWQYHLRKVFLKLGINSRAELERVLPGDQAAPSP